MCIEFSTCGSTPLGAYHFKGQRQAASRCLIREAILGPCVYMVWQQFAARHQGNNISQQSYCLENNMEG